MKIIWALIPSGTWIQSLCNRSLCNLFHCTYWICQVLKDAHGMLYNSHQHMNQRIDIKVARSWSVHLVTKCVNACYQIINRNSWLGFMPAPSLIMLSIYRDNCSEIFPLRVFTGNHAQLLIHAYNLLGKKGDGHWQQGIRVAKSGFPCTIAARRHCIIV